MKMILIFIITLYILIILKVDSYKFTKYNTNNKNILLYNTLINKIPSLIKQSSWNDFYNNNENMIITTTTNILELPMQNITTTEWSVFLDIHNPFKDQSNAAIIMNNLIKQKEDYEKNNNIIKIDKGTTNSIDTLNELYLLNGNYEYHLNIHQ